jgi:hypothetical protein
MVIKEITAGWHSYAVENKVSGVLVYSDQFEREGRMLFGKTRVVLKLARLLGRNPTAFGLVQLVGPIREHLCQ